MRIIAITGHTFGIGEAIAAWFVGRGHTIIGFSRGTGHDLAAPGMIEQIVLASLDADVFINNAYHLVAQIDLLYALHQRWQDDPTKTILTISSVGGVGKDHSVRVRRAAVLPYAVHKRALDNAIEQLQNTQPACRIMNLRPGYVDTRAVKLVVAKKMAPAYVADIAGWMVEQPSLIRSLTVTP